MIVSLLVNKKSFIFSALTLQKGILSLPLPLCWLIESVKIPYKKLLLERNILRNVKNPIYK
ncbi:hypothetical protein RKD56_002311 [Priestia megaterium]|jgi:hypothetical protein